ncbi:MAG: hypothetical protein N2484_10630 [Clostridia bacterium]|nr:hypothetical protein [Clostridia bacterium]
MILKTIKSRDGKLMVHGIITWRNGDEFGFIPQGKGCSEEWWCKMDYWDVLEGGPAVFKLYVAPASERTAL